MPFLLDEPESSETQPNRTQPGPSNHQSNEAQPDQSNTQTKETQSDPAITDLYDRIVRSEQCIGVMIDITSFDHPKIRNIVDDKFIDTTQAAPEHHAALKRRIKALLSGQSEGEKILWDFHELTLHTQPSLTPNAPSRARSICCLASELDITSDKECECGCGEKDHECAVHGKRFRVLFLIDNEPFQLDRRTAFRSEVTPEGLVTLDRKPGFEDLRAWDRALEKADRLDWGRFCWKVLWERVAASLEEAFEVRLRGDRDEGIANL